MKRKVILARVAVRRIFWRRKQSAANQSRLAVSLVSGKITGNLLDSGADPVFDSQIVPANRALLAKFPAKRIRVFWDRDQGNKHSIRDCGLVGLKRSKGQRGFFVSVHFSHTCL